MDNNLDAGRFFQDARNCMKSGRYLDAISYFEKAIEINPKNHIFWDGIGYCYQNLNEHDKAIPFFKKANECDPFDPMHWNNRGASLFILGRNDEAIECYREVIRCDPLFHEKIPQAKEWMWRALFIQGKDLSKLRKYDESNNFFDDALKLKPNLANAHFYKGRNHYCLGNYWYSIECSNHALHDDPKHIGALFYKSRSLAYLGRSDEAVDCFLKIKEIDPKMAEQLLAEMIMEKGEANQNIKNK